MTEFIKTDLYFAKEKEFYALSQEDLMELIDKAEVWLQKNEDHRLFDTQFYIFRTALRVYSERYSNKKPGKNIPDWANDTLWD